MRGSDSSGLVSGLKVVQGLLQVAECSSGGVVACSWNIYAVGSCGG